MKSLLKRQLLPLRWWLFIGFCVTVAIAFGVGPALHAYRLSQARRALGSHHLDRALDWLEVAKRNNRESAAVEFLLARTHRKLGDLETARGHLENASKLGYPETAIERERWMAVAQSGRLREAEPNLQSHLAKSGEDAQEICEALVSGYLRNYDFNAARNWLDAWQADFPVAAQPHYCRGLIWRHLMMYAKATDELATALELQPERNDIRFELAKTLELQRKYDEAAQHYRRCRHDRPDDPQAISGLAHCLIGLRKNAEAKALYQRILQRLPEDVEANLGLAKLELAAGHPEDAARRLRPIAAKNAYHKELRHVLASALRAIGEHDEARIHSDFVREANEGLARAEKMLEQVRMNPKLVSPRYEIGVALLKYASPAKGAAWLRSVLELDPRHQPTHEALADYYTQQENWRLAEEHRRLANAAKQRADGS